MAYGPGQTCPESGVYRVAHDRAHKQQHEITMVKGKTFPPCAGCTGHGPSYVLVRRTEHLTGR
jgi:hypothetical protein